VAKKRQWRKRYSDVIGQAKIQSGRLFQHPAAAILNYHFAQTALFFQISNTEKEELKIIILVKFFFFGLIEVIVKNGGGKMLEQPLPMSSALWASARSLGFPMGYIYFLLLFLLFVVIVLHILHVFINNVTNYMYNMLHRLLPYSLLLKRS